MEVIAIATKIPRAPFPSSPVFHTWLNKVRKAVEEIADTEYASPKHEHNEKDLPTATKKDKGLVQIGDGLKIAGGVVSADNTNVVTVVDYRLDTNGYIIFKFGNVEFYIQWGLADITEVDQTLIIDLPKPCPHACIHAEATIMHTQYVSGLYSAYVNIIDKTKIAVTFDNTGADDVIDIFWLTLGH